VNTVKPTVLRRSQVWVFHDYGYPYAGQDLIVKETTLSTSSQLYVKFISPGGSSMCSHDVDNVLHLPDWEFVGLHDDSEGKIIKFGEVWERNSGSFKLSYEEHQDKDYIQTPKGFRYSTLQLLLIASPVKELPRDEECYCPAYFCKNSARLARPGEKVPCLKSHVKCWQCGGQL